MKWSDSQIKEILHTDKYKRIGFTTRNGYKLKGYISLSEGFSKGSLLLTELYEPNGKYYEISQYVQGMPKIKYLGRDWKYIKDKQFENIHILEKLDGTNIVYFPVYLHGEVIDIHYKTRGMSTVGEPFNKLIDETNQDEEIRELVYKYPNSYSFELYGYKNPILIQYEFPIRLTLLTIMKWRYIYPYSEVVNKYYDHVKPLFIFKDKYKVEFRDGGEIYFENYLDLYNKIEEFLDAINKNGAVYEGVVWNIEWDNENHLYKNKSRALQPLYSDLKTSDIRRLYREAIRVYSIPKNEEDLIEFIVNSLKSDGYTDVYINKWMDKIVSTVRYELKREELNIDNWMEVIYEEVKKELNNEMDDLGLVMRTYAEICPRLLGNKEYCKKQSSKFYNYILNKGR